MGHSIAGYESGRTITPIELSWGGLPLEYTPGGYVMDSAKSIDGANTNYTYEIRAGWAIGLITSSKKIVPCKRTRANGAGSSTATLVVDNAAAFAAGDNIDIGAATNKTISSVNYSTNTITLSATTTWSDRDAVVARDGSQTCIGFVDEFTKLKNLDNTAAQDKLVGKIVVGGVLNKNYLLGDIASIVADTTSANQLRGRIKIYDPSTNTYTL